MKSVNPQVTGILLAGGLSKRMGREKGELKIGNRRMAEYPLGVLETCCSHILISTCKPEGSYHGHPAVCDEIKGIGPIAGILACLERSTTDLNLVLSYDLPLVRTGLLELLIDESQGHEVVVPALHPDRPEPLCALYRKSVAPVLREMIRNGEYAVHQITGRTVSHQVLIDDTHSFYHPLIFLNINRQEDLSKLPPETLNG